MKYGLYDLVDNCWMGNVRGPVTYDDMKTAQLAGKILNERCKYDNRIIPKIYIEKVVYHKDNIKPALSFKEALRRLK